MFFSMFSVLIKFFLKVGTRSLACAWFEDTAKHQRLCTQITHMDLTWLGCALVVVDSHGQLYLFKVPPILEPGT